MGQIVGATPSPQRTRRDAGTLSLLWFKTPMGREVHRQMKQESGLAVMAWFVAVLNPDMQMAYAYS